MKSTKLFKSAIRYLSVMVGCIGLLGMARSPAMAETNSGASPDPLAIMAYKPQAPAISVEFPYESKYVEVLGSKMHYVEKGTGDPILFLHGNPTSMYLWRNVMPHLEKQGRVIAFDLIGFGKSDKPDLDYTFADHIRYVEGFIEAKKLKNITLVIHDWGSGLGLDYAARNESNVKGIAMMEAIVPPGAPVASYEAMGPYGGVFKAMRDPKTGPELLVEQNKFIEVILPAAVMRDLTEEEMEAYRAPFLEKSSRKPILVWPNEVSIGGVPENTTNVINNYGQWLMKSTLPKLHLYVSPGALNPPQLVDFLKTKLNNYETVYVGGGIHFIQEDHPHEIGLAISDWVRRQEL